MSRQSHKLEEVGQYHPLATNYIKMDSKLKRFDFRMGSSGFDLYSEPYGEYVKFKDIQQLVNNLLKNIQTIQSCPNTGNVVPNHNRSVENLKTLFKEADPNDLAIDALRQKAEKLGFSLVKREEESLTSKKSLLR